MSIQHGRRQNRPQNPVAKVRILGYENRHAQTLLFYYFGIDDFVIGGLRQIAAD